MTGLALTAWIGVALGVFITGTAWRLLRYLRAPVHLRWDLYPVAHEPLPRRRYGGSYLEEREWWTRTRRRDLGGEIGVMAAEILLLKGVRDHNRRLWRASAPFHWGLYLLAATTAGVTVLAAGWRWPGAAAVLDVTGAAGGGLLLLGAAALLVLRSTDRGLATYTTILDRANLALLAVFGALSVAVALSAGGVAGAAGLLGAMARGQRVAVPALTGVQMACGSLFLLYLPFTRMIHFLAKYFTYHQVRWDDRALEPGSRMARRVSAALDYGVDWSAPHVQHGKTWAEVAASMPGNGDGEEA